MSGTLRICMFRLCPGSSVLRNTAKQSTIALSKSTLVTVPNQTAEDGFIKIPPFPYKDKKYTRLHVAFPFLDPTQVRMNKNSKVVVVEGNMGSKKADVAKGIADAFGLHYLPEPRIEEMYINHEGFDYRILNKYIHPKLWAVDEKMYYENPHLPGVPWMKIFFYKIRYLQYIDALAHLFNTGQGVVLERSPHSDLVFTEAMYKCGFLPKDAYDFYYRLRFDTIHELKRPHLIVYLDTDIDVAMKRIKEEGVPHKVNSKVLTRQYLQEIDNAYKREYLDDASNYSEVLIFKWNQPNQPLDDMILNIEKTNLDTWDKFESKFRDWNFYMNYLLHENRYAYTREKHEILTNFEDTLLYDVESLYADANDCEHRDKVYESFVPNYGQLSASKNLLVSIFRQPHWRKLEEFCIRAPFY